MSSRSQATRQRLIVAARELLLEQGLAVSLSEVAERAGVTRMTLYRHFGPRRDLLLEVLLTEVTEVATACRQLLDDPAGSLTVRAHSAMTYLAVEFASAPLVTSILVGSTMTDLEELDPNGSVRNLITDTAGSFLDEADAAGLLRGTIDSSVAWIGRQVLAMAYQLPGEHRDPQVIADEVARHFLPSILRITDAECEALIGHPPPAVPSTPGGDVRERAAVADLN